MSDLLEFEIKDILPSDAVQDCCDLAFCHRQEAENLRKIAPVVIESLLDTRLFRMGLPKYLGGWENTPVETLKVYEHLASAEASAAWIVWNNHLACTFGRFLDEASMREVYKDYTHVYANSARPEGTAQIVPNGYLVNGL